MNNLPAVTHVATVEDLERVIREWRRELDEAAGYRIVAMCSPFDPDWNGIYGSPYPTSESEQYRGTAGSRRPYVGPDGRTYEVVLTGGIATKDGEPLLDCFREVRLPDREQIPCWNCETFSDRGMYSLNTNSFICDDCK